MKTSRIDPILNRLHLSHRDARRNRAIPRLHPIRETHPDREKLAEARSRMFEDDLRTAYVAFQTKSLDDDPHVPRLVKWLLRRIYHRYAWTAMGHDGKSYTKWEFLGVFDTATNARWAAMVPGGSWMELPLNQSLPEESSQFGAHDFPHSSASHEYRNRRHPFVTLPRAAFEALDDKVAQTLDCAHGKCNSRTV